MQAFMNILVLALCLGLASAAVQRSALRPDSSLLQFMVENRAVQAKSPQQSIECFNYYTPLMSDIASKYEKDYQVCLDIADAATEKLNSLAEAQRNSLHGMATSSCNAIASCYTLSDAGSMFECYQSVSSNNTKEYYTISSTAQDDLTNLHEQEHVIEFETGRCTDKCDNTYVKDTSVAYEELQSCLAGLTSVPTKTTTTQAPATTESRPSTDAPTTTESTTSTQAPATQEPGTPEQSETA